MNLFSFGFTLILIIYITCCFTNCDKLDFKEILFAILSQENSRHVERALKLKNEISKQTNFSSNIYLTHIDLKHIGGWTILPILNLIWKKHKQKFSWVIFATDETYIDTIRLKELLEDLNPDVTFLGRALNDKNPTIIHHFFSSPNFNYPLFSSGFALHFTLIKKLIDKLDNDNFVMAMDFSIDASHELALFIKNNANNTLLTHSPFFCVDFKKGCATHIKNNYICDKTPVNIKKIHFAVKTCSRFHKDRIPVVLKTWAQWTHHISFYSDLKDKNIPTIKLEIENTEQGHCAKTQEILKEAKKKIDLNKNLEWIVISDDDTLFSIYRLQELLGCYNSSDPIVLGERYGYNVINNFGYNYATGGGGVIFSKEAVIRFSEGLCKCPSNSTPDDMFLFGVCLRPLNITLIHIPLFHQARPNDYNEEYLMIGPPISFHKHWMIDPIQVYKEWFLLSDLLSSKNYIHTEL